jgi:hypothetical protein
MAKSNRRDFFRSSALAAATLGDGTGPVVGESAKGAGDMASSIQVWTFPSKGDPA